MRVHSEDVVRVGVASRCRGEGMRFAMSERVVERVVRSRDGRGAIATGASLLAAMGVEA
jgi:hypothetical protein